MRLLVDPSELRAGDLLVGGGEHHYVARVRRARVGDRVELFDGAGHRAPAEIVAIDEQRTRLRVGEVVALAAAPPRITALVPLIKGDRMELCLEKLVEVGADELVIWPAARSVVRLDGERRGPRAARLRAAAQAAARQCGRADVPVVELVEDLGAALARVTGAAARLVLDPRADAGPRLPSPAPSTAAIASGPEGGLAPDELERLATAGFVGVGLGPRILRAETAPVVLVALLRAATAT